MELHGGLAALGHIAGGRVQPKFEVCVRAQLVKAAVFKFPEMVFTQVLQNDFVPGAGKKHLRRAQGALHGAGKHCVRPGVTVLRGQRLQLCQALPAQGFVRSAADIAALQVAGCNAVAYKVQAVIFHASSVPFGAVFCAMRRILRHFGTKSKKFFFLYATTFRCRAQGGTQHLAARVEMYIPAAFFRCFSYLQMVFVDL